ncbi:hypothetical protein A5886_000346 [Enterococcus sp. 8G7_MSG3316]|uniref:Maltose phosphorylase n=1 Tax=Candidatus Enterococcus testudinis TaxID=1834191 RepID=A0A242A2L3_9ENTE|nr:glycosyl hydrolase family 65 protein [Enterococcus sp. 8G7_MSG3316]OTN75276.1 hypothetical protein A5886_000346 [Enterococcus sp. 8G7_MSG3316]
MGKIADMYYMVNPWIVSEKGFEKSRSEVSESIFSLANEYMGIRGYFEEGYSGETLIGSYFNGVYENSPKENHVKYKGIVARSHFMVNAVDWLYTRIWCDNTPLDLANAEIDNFERHLDLRTGILIRSFHWKPNKETKVKLIFKRMLNMEEVTQGYQTISIEALEGEANLTILMGVDFNMLHKGEGQNFWQEQVKSANHDSATMIAETITTKQKIYAGFSIVASKSLDTRIVERDKFIGLKFNVKLKESEVFSVERKATMIVNKTGINEENLNQTGSQALKSQVSFNIVFERNRKYWENVWSKEDIQIEGDTRNQQGIRYCIFQLHQTYHGQDPNHNIGAKGLTGEAYGGLAFWDTETCCLPFYLLTNLAAAKNLLEFRYYTLSQAKERAKQLDCEGACYPIATLNGHEACDLWQHASLQFQPSTGVAYGIWHYVNVSHDKEFLYSHGIEVLIEISRFLVSRGAWSANGEFGFFGVMGPDEFQMMVNHNAYTNYMAKRTLEYTIEVLEEMKAIDRTNFHSALEKCGLLEKEYQSWQVCAEKMVVLKDENGLIEQHDGFFKLPQLDIHSIPIDEFPLYDHWSYDRIYRNNMIKQPDVLMFLFLYNQSFGLAEKQVNYEFYEPKTIHESSLSPSIHSILASELGKDQEAYQFFEFATRMDLDNFNRNTREGLHTTSIASAWMNIVYGFGGVRTDGKELMLSPTIPEKWESYTFKITYQERLIQVTVDRKAVKISLLRGDTIKVQIYHEVKEITNIPLVIDTRK